eukprot:gene1943-2625_t
METCNRLSRPAAGGWIGFTSHKGRLQQLERGNRHQQHLGDLAAANRRREDLGNKQYSGRWERPGKYWQEAWDGSGGFHGDSAPTLALLAVAAAPVGEAMLLEVVDYISATWPYWNRHNGNDHLFVLPGDHGSKLRVVYSHGVREKVLKMWKEHPGFDFIQVQFHHGEPVEHSERMASSRFCLVMTGTGFSDRLAVSIGHGCVPVIIADDVLQPWEDDLPYGLFSIRIPESDIEQLPTRLGSVTPTKYLRMRRALECVAHRFFWSSVYGASGRETGMDDAFAMLLLALQNRRDFPNAQHPPSAQLLANGGHAPGSIVSTHETNLSQSTIFYHHETDPAILDKAVDELCALPQLEEPRPYPISPDPAHPRRNDPAFKKAESHLCMAYSPTQQTSDWDPKVIAKDAMLMRVPASFELLRRE